MTTGVDRRLRYGIIGCGDATRRLIIPGLKNSNRAQLVCIASRDVQKARTLAIEAQCEYASSYEDLLNQGDIDVIYIALPISLHAQWTMRAIKSGKHVHCEKSLAPCLEEVVKILESAQKNDRRVMEGFMFRFHTLYKTVQDLIASGEIGILKSFVGSFGFPLEENDLIRRNPAMKMGILNETGCYTISAASGFFNQNPDSVLANLEYKNQLEIGGCALLKFGPGENAYCEFGYDRGYRCSYTLWGTEGHIVVERAYTTPPTMEPIIEVRKQEGSKSIKIPAENHFSKMIDTFCEAILRGTGKETFEQAAYHQAVVMEAVRKSYYNKDVVFLNELKVNF
ncbi:hypothetical protein A3B21_00195 [Candidatus Uhrbacteria bacterium RIFCSPLOWO2_01_FULL_47_24]|uniref:Uncharacterized protein n=1 Tax=Candidatus Uhrbacteria bacterium RIFCSPLOWO2_01_FULL_47_24 TaxID=1802401 RepID=A0A1F7USR7_9BACT|nr:MAG: hypothetical protein A2753_01225 [Candidatus Uhrbacteria bacterium RIFCSPHIGHO2_01_FULL_47_11]OGL68017.1 MAG: hypothetical protein A3D58_01570 [Candidatus Uhrbacteria bacterium RIFCSPHIGHO2_02_FULL_46_47]OGL75427.1 MAG: hypothetical protein A3F52_04915 [Candidatus Uhrbacteria bacterium RIFCSPHIGHO2_12_FULL_47_11]OGL81331.1 MAG: hypothetical protein A3B21_00195 [Candidatus Uhrbacteria bacterium RIFCSPLOWO2_01_FULL_47_24]OGL83925.1 MAG: hypothetical protein A3J03_00710 [Candidatus Uhrbact